MQEKKTTYEYIVLFHVEGDKISDPKKNGAGSNFYFYFKKNLCQLMYKTKLQKKSLLIFILFSFAGYYNYIAKGDRSNSQKSPLTFATKYTRRAVLIHI